MSKKNNIVYLTALSALLISEVVFAASGTGIQGLADGIRKQVASIADILIIVSYVAGVGFALAGVVQFKAHKDNPVQVPLSKPIVYLVVGASLLFLPTIMETAKGTIFGDSADSALEEKFTSKLK